MAVVACGLAIPILGIFRDRLERRKVEALLSGKQWDQNLPAVANWDKGQHRLEAQARQVVRVLRQDLDYDPATERGLARLPNWLAEVFEPIGAAPSESIRANAAHFLGRLGPRACEAVPDLCRRVDDPDDRVRHEAAIALGAVGDASGPVLEALTKLATNSSSLCRTAAAFSLWRLQPNSTNALARLKPIDPHHLAGLTWHIGRMGETARPLLPALRDAIAHTTQFDTRLYAVRAYWRVSRDPKLPVELARKQVEWARTTDSRQQLSSLTLVLGEVPEVRPFLRNLQGDHADLNFIRDELDRIERWQTNVISGQPRSVDAKKP